MLNYIWAILIMVGIMVAAFTGTMENVSTGILDSSREAIQLCIVMLGVVGMWTGIMKLAEATSLVRQLTRLLMPILRLLFPRIAGDEKQWDTLPPIWLQIFWDWVGRLHRPVCRR